MRSLIVVLLSCVGLMAEAGHCHRVARTKCCVTTPVCTVSVDKCTETKTVDQPCCQQVATQAPTQTCCAESTPVCQGGECSQHPVLKVIAAPFRAVGKVLGRSCPPGKVCQLPGATVTVESEETVVESTEKPVDTQAPTDAKSADVLPPSPE